MRSRHGTCRGTSMLTHCETLLETARPISRAAWRAAKALDAKEAARFQRPLGPRPEPETDGMRVARMARAMLLRVTASGACSEADLFCAGFTAAEIARHGDAARSLAQDLRRAERVAQPRKSAASCEAKESR